MPSSTFLLIKLGNFFCVHLNRDLTFMIWIFGKINSTLLCLSWCMRQLYCKLYCVYKKLNYFFLRFSYTDWICFDAAIKLFMADFMPGKCFFHSGFDIEILWRVGCGKSFTINFTLFQGIFISITFFQ